MRRRRKGAESTAPVDPNVPAIELRDVHKAFGDQVVLRGVSLKVPAGTTYVVLGRSGAGKSVLLKLVAGLLHPDQGSVWIDGEDLATLSPLRLQHVWRKMGILFQGGALFDSLSVFDNVAFPLRERREHSSREIAERVREVLAQLRLEHVEDALPASLSGGMQKRVALARAIALGPKILLDDDPTAGLDPILSSHVADALITLRRELGMTSLLITHDLPLAFQIADRVALLHEGRLVVEAPPSQFMASQHPDVSAFLEAWLARRREHEGAPSPSPGA